MIALSTVVIEKQIADYKLEFDYLKDDEIEWHYQPPAFVVAFVRFIDKFQRVPAQQEFADCYVAMSRVALNDEFLGVRQRAERPAKKRAFLARL